MSVFNYLKDKSWRESFAKQGFLNSFNSLEEFLISEYESKEIYPNKEDLFSAFNLTPLSSVKVVIVGQDPYHGPGQAHGLSFSVRDRVKIPPSLKNIFKELHNDIGLKTADTGNLTAWAKQGVLLINNVLTVEKGTPGSHKGRGWEEFTDKAIDILNSRTRPIVFILWGAHAQKKCEAIDSHTHLVLNSPHPSPFSARKGFFGCSHFSKTNEFLKATGQDPINWSLN